LLGWWDDVLARIPTSEAPRIGQDQRPSIRAGLNGGWRLPRPEQDRRSPAPGRRSRHQAFRADHRGSPNCRRRPSPSSQAHVRAPGRSSPPPAESLGLRSNKRSWADRVVAWRRIAEAECIRLGSHSRRCPSTGMHYAPGDQTTTTRVRFTPSSFTAAAAVSLRTLSGCRRQPDQAPH